MPRKEKEAKTEFDTDLSPQNPHNVQAAKDHGLTYDSGKRAYVDAEGSLVRDQFGQPY